MYSFVLYFFIVTWDSYGSQEHNADDYDTSSRNIQATNQDYNIQKHMHYILLI